MSWKTAQAVAEKVYEQLRAEHDPGFVRMVIRALTRRLNRDENENPASQASINPVDHDQRRSSPMEASGGHVPPLPPGPQHRRDSRRAPPAEPLL